MATRDKLRYVLAVIVGLFMFVTAGSPWNAIGAGVVLVALIAGLWHWDLATRRSKSADAER